MLSMMLYTRIRRFPKYIDVKVEALCAGYKVQELLVTPGSKHQAAPHDCFSKSELLPSTAEVTTDH